MGLFSTKIVSVISFVAFSAVGLNVQAQELKPVAKPAQIYRTLASELRGFHGTQTTLLGGLLQPLTSHYVRMDLTAPSGQAMEAHLWRARGKSQGLYVLIPGLGSDAKAGLANSLGETISNSGYDTLILANPFSASFQKTFSSDGLVGFPQKDRADLDVMLKTAVDTYRAQYGRPRSTGLIGYSMGGFYTVVSARAGAPVKFDRYIALNPPIDFTYAMDQLDGMLRLKLSQSYSLTTLLSDFLHIITGKFNGLTVGDVERLRQIIPGNDMENRQVIGMSVASSLNEITENLASTEAFADDRGRLRNAKSAMTFNRYMGIVGMALADEGYFRGKTFAQLSAENDLRRVLRNVPAQTNLFVLHNEDDVLVRRSDLKSLGSQLGERLLVFDAGGHCGNYWVPSFKRELKTFMNSH